MSNNHMCKPTHFHPLLSFLPVNGGSWSSDFFIKDSLLEFIVLQRDRLLITICYAILGGVMYASVTTYQKVPLNIHMEYNLQKH